MTRVFFSLRFLISKFAMEKDYHAYPAAVGKPSAEIAWLSVMLLCRERLPFTGKRV